MTSASVSAARRAKASESPVMSAKVELLTPCRKATERALFVQAEAEREASRLTGDARRERDDAVRAGREEAERLVSTARQEADSLLSAARRQADAAQERARALEVRRTELMADLEQKGRKGELAYRVRGVHEIAGHGYEERQVDLLAAGVWVVWLDLDLFESVKGMTVKQTAIRYPLRVVSLAVDPEANPWGLALDGFATDGPRRLTELELDEDTAQEH